MSRYKCKHFKIYELVDRETYKKYGQKAWWFFNERALRGMDELWEGIYKETGKRPSIIVNDWKWRRGGFQWRGLRTARFYLLNLFKKIKLFFRKDINKAVSYSDHMRGDAFDFDVKGMSAEEVRVHIRANYEKYGITAIENGVNWVHASWRNCKPLMQFNP